jgi:YHS domain-containing protein
MRYWIRALLAVTLVAGLSLGFTVISRAADKDAPKKDEKKGDGKDDKKGDSKDDKKPAAEEKKKDPKDMTAAELDAAGLCVACHLKPSKPVYHADYKDKEYHFCTRDCQKAFAASPANYVKDAPAPKK